MFSGFFGVFLVSLIGYRAGFFAFILLFFLGQFTSSYIDHFYLFVATYAGPAGFSQGAIGILPLYCVWRYFKDNEKHKVSGFILSAYALAPIPLSYMA